MFNIMLVEDNAMFRQQIRDVLLARFPSTEVREAANGDEALKEVDRDCPELIVMDIRLPGKNGLELAKEIRSMHPHVVVIILTSYDFPEYREATDNFGIDHYFVKGSTRVSELLALVESIEKDCQKTQRPK